jgi:hypothetical protein
MDVYLIVSLEADLATMEVGQQYSNLCLTFIDGVSYNDLFMHTLL